MKLSEEILLILLLLRIIKRKKDNAEKTFLKKMGITILI
jgi:hypothetical protein